MSWSLNTALKHPNAGTEVLDQLQEIDRSNIGNAHSIKERDEQIDAAFDVVSQLVAGPAFVNADEISISLSGHANPEHKHADGWPNDSVSISVTIKSYREPVS